MYQNDEKLDANELGGDPATKERAKLRKECKPAGPYGLLLADPPTSGSF